MRRVTTELQPSGSSSTSWRQRGGKERPLLSADTPERVISVVRGVCGYPTAATQLHTREARARLVTSQREGALLIPSFVQSLRQGEHEG